MKYFTPDFLNFFAELSMNNERDWFNANKSRFQNNVEKPFHAFIGDLIERAQEIDGRILLTSKDAVFRVYRDTRFGADKTPYKTHMSAIISLGGRKNLSDSGMYLQMGCDDFRIYGGAYQPEKQQLQGIREAIASDLSGFAALISEPNFVKKYGSLLGDENKRLPSDLMEAAVAQPLIFKKSFYFFHAFDAETILGDGLMDTCMDYFLTGKPVGDFLAKAMAPPNYLS